jgi:hypothetical protein
VVASVLSALVIVAIPGIASARHPRHNYHLTINSTPNPIIAGDSVLVYGQLKGPALANQTIRLYHHVVGGPPGYSLISTTTTDQFGFYEFVRADGIVDTNRSWFAAGPNASHSRTISERVASVLTITASTSNATTGQPVTFTGQATPNHAFERVLLQEQSASSGDWHTLRSAMIGPGSNYAVRFTWRTPGERDVRVVLPADARNIRGESDAVPVTIQQRQVTGFTINSSNPVTPYGTPVTISGVLTPGPTAQPAIVELWARPTTGGPFTMIGTSPVSASGAYSFTETPLANTIYQARVTFGAIHRSAPLWEGVRDLVTLTPSSTTSMVGGKVTFTGDVMPGKAGHVVYLQRLGADGEWHAVESTFASSLSTFQFDWTFARQGTYQFRARIFSDGHNVGAPSAPVRITVMGIAPVTTLPPGNG